MSDQPLQNRSWILFAVSILGVMVQVDYTAVNVGLEAMSRSVHSDLPTIQWVLSAYVLAWGSMVIGAGRLADIFGKRRIFLLGTFLFLLGSALSGFAHAAWFLIASRVIQGIGGALFLPALYTLVFTAYPENERGKAMGILTAALALGMAIGPTLGGVILHILDWRWIFFVNLPLGAIVIGIILWTVDKEPRRLLDESMDYLGFALLVLSVLSFMTAIDHAQTWGVDSPYFIACIIGTIIFASAFVMVENRRKHPLVSMSLFKNKPFIGCMISYVTMGYNFASILILSGLYLQNSLGLSALHAGFAFLAMTITFGGLSVYGGKLADRMDVRIPIVIGSLGTIFGVICFAFLTPTGPLWLLMVALALAGVGLGLAFPALNTAMMSSVASNELNTASATFTMFGCLGNTSGLILSSILIVYFGKTKLFDLITASGISLSSSQKMNLMQVMSSTHYSSQQLQGFSAQQLPEVMNNVHIAFCHAISMSMVVAMVLGLLGLIAGLVMIRLRSKQVETDVGVTSVA